MNVLSDEIYGYWYNSNKAGGLSAKSWARAYYMPRQFTPLRRCHVCGMRKTPKRMSNEFYLCFSCGNKKKGLMKRAEGFVLSTGKTKRNSGVVKSLCVMLAILRDLDRFCRYTNDCIDDTLVKKNIHLSDCDDIDLGKEVISHASGFWTDVGSILRWHKLKGRCAQSMTWRDVRPYVFYDKGAQ